MFAFESAIDELANALKLDPIELRMRNEPARDPEKGLPWSSRSLIESFRQGAQRFGWERRNPVPRSMRDGRYLIGMGTASATYPTNRMPSSARVRILADGSAQVHLAATDIGTGTYTALTQIAADTLGMPTERVRVEIGDTKMPKTPGSGGSWGAASYGSAVHEACAAVRAKILGLARQDPRSPLKGLSNADMEVREGRIFSKRDRTRGETYRELLTRNNLKASEAEVESKPGEALKKYSMHAFGAQFAEVRVDPDLGMVRVTRFLGAYGTGRILNPKTARSQMIGGITMGIGMALHEETVVDERYGHFVNHDLAEYHMPVHADIPAIETFFVEENDPHVNPLGIKGVGEIGIVGVAAAVANAVYHATGKRIRDLPITPDKLL
jgi:xanthine dehydrogenase YagR molybdenum-binding subunit